MNKREEFFKAIEMEMETQKLFFDMCDKMQGEDGKNEVEFSSNATKCYFEGYIATKNDCNKLKKSSYDIYCENMSEQLKKNKKQFGFRFNVKKATEAGMLVCKIEIRRV